MKKDIIVVALIGVLFILVLGSILGSFTFYKEYKDRIGFLEQQTQSGTNRIEGVESKVDSFKKTVDDISAQIKTYSDSIKNIQNTVTLSDEERKNLLAKIEEMKNDLAGLQKDYSTTVIDMRQVMLNMKDDLDKLGGNKSKPVELGKITVKQEEKAAVKGSVSKPASSAAKSSASNFKSTNVRKADSL